MENRTPDDNNYPDYGSSARLATNVNPTSVIESHPKYEIVLKQFAKLRALGTKSNLEIVKMIANGENLSIDEVSEIINYNYGEGHVNRPLNK